MRRVGGVLRVGRTGREDVDVDGALKNDGYELDAGLRLDGGGGGGMRSESLATRGREDE